MNITIGKPWGVSEKGGRLNNEDSIYPMPEAINTNQNLIQECMGVKTGQQQRLIFLEEEEK